MAAVSSADFGDVVIIGGGCYGSFYLGQLLTARAQRRASWRRLIIVDRDPDCAAAPLVATAVQTELAVGEWGAFLDAFLADRPPAEGDRIVPSPLMPHLLLEWLQRRANARHPERPVRIDAGSALGTPYESTGADGTRYVSHADWICPVHCIEPLVCPATRAPRSWDMAETCADRAGPGVRLALFACHHVTYGVGMIDVAAVLAADASMAAAAASGDEAEFLVGTISRCHGAVTRLTVPGAARSPVQPAGR